MNDLLTWVGVIATYCDLKDAAALKWIEAASKEKLKKVMEIYRDDTFIKLRKKTEKYAF